jgi:mannose-6-phosphate isomerase-like protein (cupin superfamily)
MTRFSVSVVSLAAGAALGLAGLGGVAAAQAPGEGTYVAAAQLRANVAKTTDGLATFTVPTGPGATVLIAHREKDGEVEVHTRLNDEFVAHDGHAGVRVGGKVEGNRQTGPDEWRGGVITGGRTYQLSPGDVLWIPAGSPHQVLVPKGGSFSYLAFKFEAKPH